MNYSKKNILALVLMATICLKTHGQITKGFELHEIINIAEAYRQSPNVSFDIKFIYTDSARQDSILESINANYKIQAGRYWAMIDNTEIVQGSQYCLSIFHNDSVIAIADRQRYSNIMQLPFLDSLFRSQNIDSMNVTHINDSTNSLHMYFNRASRYSGYIISYDINSYLLRSIKYFIKTPAYDDGSGSGTTMIGITFSNYSYQVIDDKNFREDKFIYKQGGKFFAQRPYKGFQLMVGTSH